MKKQKPKKINDLSQLGSVISFKPFDENAYDAIKDKVMADLVMWNGAIVKNTEKGIEHIPYETAPDDLIDAIFTNKNLVHGDYKGFIRRKINSL